MDSPYFDAELALTDILSNSNVSQLVNKCNELQIGREKSSIFVILTIDIRSYDQDIQAMVFENYSKFITSIDTVKKVIFMC
jgi:Vps51/Vps67.